MFAGICGQRERKQPPSQSDSCVKNSVAPFADTQKWWLCFWILFTSSPKIPTNQNKNPVPVGVHPNQMGVFRIRVRVLSNENLQLLQESHEIPHYLVRLHSNALSRLWFSLVPNMHLI